VSLVLNILNNGVDPTNLNKTFISLIPKVKNPTHLGEFKLISLCNVIFKFVTKMISNRLKVIFPNLVSETNFLCIGTSHN